MPKSVAVAVAAGQEMEYKTASGCSGGKKVRVDAMMPGTWLRVVKQQEQQ